MIEGFDFEEARVRIELITTVNQLSMKLQEALSLTGTIDRQITNLPIPWFSTRLTNKELANRINQLTLDVRAFGSVFETGAKL